MDSTAIFSGMRPLKLFFFASVPGAVSMLASALFFPVILIGALWPLGLTGIWLNFPATALLAAVLSLVILLKLRRELGRPDMD